jgi:hypothetical protein
MRCLKLFSFILSLIIFNNIASQAQNTKLKIAAIGFYNLENLFDTIDAPDIIDEEFTPSGAKLWNSQKYYEKLRNMADVISMIGKDVTDDGLAILGVSEIENRTVLEDLVSQTSLESRKYSIIHFDSYDSRGIDLGLLYQPEYFSPTQAKPVPVQIYNNGNEKIFTRDILYVAGNFQGELIHILVNHWPSRRGGESTTDPWRAAAATECKKIIDSLDKVFPGSKVIVMGDLNDDPTSPSVKNVLKANGNIKKVKDSEMFNPMEQYFVRGVGTTAYRDAWSLFDQIILSKSWINNGQRGLSFYKAKIFNKEFLVQKKGNFKGYPLRTFVGNEYIQGYSDHFPVFIYVVKKD